MAEAWARRALVIVGHGSSSEPEGGRSVKALVEAVRARGVFADVRAAFLRMGPKLPDVLDDLSDRATYVVPHLAADGVVGEALSGAVADRKTIVVCQATGTHPDVARIAARCLAELRARFALSADRLGVLVAGHGTSRNPNSSARARALADALLAAGAARESAAAFIEEPPSIAEWDRLLAAADVAVVPLLMAEGRHGGNDVARLLGIEPDGTETPFAGPFPARGRRLWLMRPLGVDPGFAEIVLARVAEADR
jgi:sirohydrochlorin cobaltochelatase